MSQPPRRSLLHRTAAGTLLAFPAQRSLVLADPGDAEPAPTEYSILGYRQTEQPAAKGGKANENGLRFRHKGDAAPVRPAARRGADGRAPSARGGAQPGGFPRRGPPITMAGMDPREQIARALGLDPHATWEQIAAKQAQITASAAQASVAVAQLEDSRSALAAAQQRVAERVAELDAAHVDG